MDVLIYLIFIPTVIFVFYEAYRRYKSYSFIIEIQLYPYIISCIVLSATYGLAMFSEVYDQEIRNGRVISKEKEQVLCSHSYPCKCDKKGCSTCYHHSHDYDWVVHTSIPHKFTIDRVDSQGITEPKRWSSVKVGDPVSDSFTYVNYIKAAKHSLFHDTSNVDVSKVPEYPISVYDYQYVDRVISVGVPINKEWNRKLQDTLSALGPQYQFNAVVILTTLSETFDEALNVKWLGGKKNDAVIVIHVDNATDLTINSVYVMSWTDRSIFKIELRDSLMDLQKFDIDSVLKTMSDQVTKNWKRKSMNDFDYLRNEIDVNSFYIMLSIILSILSYLGSYFMMKNKFGMFRTTYDRKNW